MKTTINTVVTAVMAIGLFFGCKKNEQDTSFRDVNRISVEGLPADRPTADSVKYSFAAYPAVITYNLTLVVKIGGEVINTDREFKIEIDAAKTTAVPDEYTLPSSFIIKAGSVVANVPITVKRSARTRTRSVKLTLKAVPNDNFELGKKSSFTFIWTEDFIKPANWAAFFQNTLGNYSKAKHELIVLNTDYKDLDLIDPNKDFNQYTVISYLASAALAAKNEYNAAHPGAPLKNEFGEVIDICRDCK